ncbi:type I-B CRISPR-associated protein Cas5b [Alkaliphilus serpentinus]|uniref:Type I-B CRISPR-associated protein Cas5 n=1 Tax=Alkaliphilus serpentinus TaxID=1482731 RepID=A0A833HNP2_9FIRM|nr:type I-B CRISPR-associated protein Cas5b [Alkaliphilus serpentinus]KAB3529798.1 type I-B CRISPR-associated protein Cas5 [Alkaliphilus serpentinus]
MKALKFTLSGKTAFFKKPDVNTYYYFTYGNIHKIALLGILGAILGYKGYNQQVEENKAVYPEFYEKLNDIKLSIAPKNEKGYIPKKMQIYNNSVGYASKEQGGNLIVKEQWLEEPKWDIYVLIEGEVTEELAKRVIERRFQYIPYLGKNDHMANITNIKVIENIQKMANVNKVDSLFIKDKFEMQTIEADIFNIDFDCAPIFKYQEMLPIALEKTTNKYELETFLYTNASLIPKGNLLVYQCEENTLYFF